jgi:small-conductance mechanosensitive channel
MSEWMGVFWEALRAFGGLLAKELFKIGDTPVSIMTFLTILAIMAVTVWLSRTVRRILDRVLTGRGWKPGMIGSVNGLIHYFMLVVGFGIALETAGINLTALFAAGAVFAVAIGFAMQSIVQNFVAGVILLSERAIKPGDILEVEGRVVKVLDMGIRASIVRTRDGEDIIIPNSLLIQAPVKNFTLKDSRYRIRAKIGVVYASDMKEVKEVLFQAAKKISEDRGIVGVPPQVFLKEFGYHSVVWEVAFWMADPWESYQAQSDLMEDLWWELKDHQITIAFPQVDVHFDPDVGRGLAAIGTAVASG